MITTILTVFTIMLLVGVNSRLLYRLRRARASIEMIADANGRLATREIALRNRLSEIVSETEAS